MSTKSQRNFAAGEVAPAIYPKVDQTKYQTGVKTARNAYVMRHGGLASRPGTKFVCEIKSSSATVRLIPFKFDDNVTYFFELGNLYIRRIKNGAYILEPAANVKTITAVSSATQAVFTSASHGYSDGRELYVSGIVGTTELNGRYFTISDKTTDTYKLKYKDGSYVDTTAMTAYASGGRTLLVDEVVTTYTTDELPEIRYAQFAAAVIFTHPSHQQAVVLAYNAVVSPAYPGLITAPIDVVASSTVTTPTSFASATDRPGAFTQIWYLTAIDDATGEESVAATVTKTSQLETPSAANDHAFSFTAVSGCSYYNFYRKTLNRTFGYLATISASEASSFSDAGQWTLDPSRRPSSHLSVLSSSNNYPSCVGVLQQRFVFGNSNANSNRLWLSRIGNNLLATTGNAYISMQRSFPLQDDDAFLFDLIDREYGSIKHILEMEVPVIFTGSGEYALNGDQSGALLPTAINKSTLSKNGASRVAPVVVDSTAVYIQERGQLVRDLSPFQADGYQGTDLTAFSGHLVEGLSIVDMAYQKTPHSVVWLVRSDGVLLSLTHIKEHRIVGWARHDFDGGLVENVVCVPEGLEHVVYVVVKRTIATNGADRTVRYVERMSTRLVGDITNFVGMDSAVTRDGTNATSTTMTISGGTSWTSEEHLTVTASSVVGVNLGLDAGQSGASTGLGFSSSDVGNAIYFYNDIGEVLTRITIDEYVSPTVVRGRSSEDVPAALRSAATATWGHAKKVVAGLWHLVGEQVSILGDGNVVASPKNAQYDTVTVAANGTVTLAEPCVKVHVGLPFISDIETLSVDADQSETLIDKKSLPSRVTLQLEKTRGVFAGPQPPSSDSVDPIEKLTELPIRNLEGYNESTDLFTGAVTVNIQPNWNNLGRIFIRQVDPLPMTVNSIHTAGLFPFQKKGGA